ncbi:MAG: undecaprenyl-diphosphate phosphatase [Planctomycetes bacterium]|nr:undecaprenyl-diphosphate phosphatase [Planctomycetota bacterium]
MSFFESFILGLIQGIAEFLPISSSGHLAIGEAVFGMKDPEANLAFIVFLHLVSVLAILVALFDEIKDIIFGMRFKAVLWVIVGTIPAGVIGLLFNDKVDKLFDPAHLYLVGIALIINGFILLAGEISGWGEGASVDKVGFKNSLLIGIAQAIAIIPGISRSGSTVSGGLAFGLKKKDAVVYSFLLAIPVILGAAYLELKDFGKFKETFQPIPIITAGITCFITSIIAIKILMRVVQKSKLHYFSFYCFFAGAATIIWFVLK